MDQILYCSSAKEFVLIKENGEKQPMNGLAQVRVFTDNVNLFNPFLPYRFKGMCYYGLCKKCIENKQQQICKHSKEERSWCGVYTSVDLNYAHSLGYRFKFFEVMQFKDRSSIFRNFITILSSFKMRYSGFPNATDMSLKRKTDFCNEMNFRNEYTKESLKLTPENVLNAPTLRFLTKLLLNR